MSKAYFLVVCLKPILQKTIILNNLLENEVNRSNEYYLEASGEGFNSSRLLRCLGEEVILFTHGGGKDQKVLLSLIEKSGIECCWIKSNAEIQYCFTLLNRENNTTTKIITETNSKIAAETEKRMGEEFQKLLPDCHTLILAGPKTAGFSKEIYPGMVKEAKKLNKQVILDLSGDDLKNSLIFGPDLIKFKLQEFRATFENQFSLQEQESSAKTIAAVTEKMLQLYERQRTVSVVTSREYGIFFIQQGRLAAIPLKMILPENTIDNENAFTAGLAAGWHQTNDIETAVKKGIDCAAMKA